MTSHDDAAEESGMVKLTEADHLRRVILRPQEIVLFEVTENPGTGYRWQLELSEGTTVLNVLSNEYRARKAPGAAGLRTIRLQAIKRGCAQIKLHLARPWESAQHEAALKVIVDVI
jgi:inhibitor of cysteine peptidase